MNQRRIAQVRDTEQLCVEFDQLFDTVVIRNGDQGQVKMTFDDWSELVRQARLLRAMARPA